MDALTILSTFTMEEESPKSMSENASCSAVSIKGDATSNTLKFAFLSYSRKT